MNDSQSPLVSVVIATYNAERLLGRTIRNALAQTYSNIEVVVVDDGSTDGTRGLMADETARDPRLKYVYQENQERGAARNRGIRESRGEYVAFIDQDDLWMPTKLERQLSAIRLNPNAICCYCLFGVMQPDGSERFSTGEAPPEGDIFEPLLNCCPIGSMTPLIARSCFDRVGGFNEDRRLSCFCDWEMWTRLATIFPWVLVPEHLGLHCLHGANTQRAPDHGDDELRIHLMERYELSRPQREILDRYRLARRWHWAAALYKERPFVALKVLAQIGFQAPERLAHRHYWGLVIRSGLRSALKPFS